MTMACTLTKLVGGTPPASCDWMTVSASSPDKEPPPTKHLNFAEPLVQSVRIYLANEVPSSELALVQRRDSAELNFPHTCDAEIGAAVIQLDEAYKPIDFQSHLKRNDLNNNSKNKNGRQVETQDKENKGKIQAAMPNQAERMQRQPLLARVKPEPAQLTTDESDERDDRTPSPHRLPSDFTIEIPPAAREERYPKEIWKTVISFFFLSGCVCINMISLSLVHERLPDRNTTQPLNDIFLDNVSARDWGLSASEVIIMMSTTTAMLVVIFHKHRFIVSRRLFLIIGLLYLYRSVTMFITVMPVSSKTYFCSPKSNDTTPLIVLRRMFYLISGFGLSINGKHTYCGDYIYSGHTMILVTSYLVISEYSPKRLWPVHWAAWLAALAGVLLILLAHGHYTLDIVIAYYISTRLFWCVHALVDTTGRHGAAGGREWLQREWWYPLLAYLERNVRGPVPRRYDWPLPWPRTKLFSRLS